jgi:uncharacterized membrane protein
MRINNLFWITVCSIIYLISSLSVLPLCGRDDVLLTEIQVVYVISLLAILSFNKVFKLLGLNKYG